MEIAQYGIKIDSVTDSQINLWKLFISEEKRKRTERFRFWDDTKRCVIGEIMVRYAIHDLFHVNTHEIEFELLKYGKPAVKGHKEWQFSLSHSAQWVICAVGMCPVGIDVEKMDIRHLGIASGFYTPNENARIKAFLSDRDRMIEFYKLWTLKESYMKAIGLGLIKGMDTFEFRLEGDKEILFDRDSYNRDFSFCSMLLDEQYTMSLCYNSSAKVRKMKLLNGDMLEEMCSTFLDNMFGGRYDKSCS